MELANAPLVAAPWSRLYSPMPVWTSGGMVTPWSAEFTFTRERWVETQVLRDGDLVIGYRFLLRKEAEA